MASELINVRIFDESGDIEWGLSLTISIYNVTDSVGEIVWIPMVYNAPFQRYQYSFTNFDPNKEYLCDIDCSSAAIVRYLSCGLGDQNAGSWVWNYSDKPLILNLNDRMSKIL